MAHVRKEGAPLSSLLHVYKTVAAQLFRAQERSTVAEEAWARATIDGDVHLDSTDARFFNRLDRTRCEAIGLIHDANLPTALAERAAAALDHAFYAALSQIQQVDAPKPA
jgi:hypothetical protein